MTKPTRTTPPTRTSRDQLAREASEWTSGTTRKGFEEAPEAVPRASATQSISLRMPNELLAILKVFAAKRKVGYQVLIKQWLDDRVLAERQELFARRRSAGRRLDCRLSERAGRISTSRPWPARSRPRCKFALEIRTMTK